MQIQIENLSGAALDWAVAMAAGHKAGDLMRAVMGTYNEPSFNYTPSTNWAQGGPIIERERITLDLTNVQYDPDTDTAILLDMPEWWASKGDATGRGPTPLIAAMRCYVATRLGDTVEVPDELAA